MRGASTLGRWFFALGLFGSGLQQLITFKFVRLVPGVPAWLPWPAVCAAVAGVLLAAAGVVLALRLRPMKSAAWVAAALLAILFIGFYVPQLVEHPTPSYMWVNPFKTLALFGGALLLIEPSGPGKNASRFLGAGSVLSGLFLGVFLFDCGVEHFKGADFVDTLVPKWIPPSQRFWTYFSAVALLAGGVGLILPWTRRLAATLVGVMIFLWVLLLHVPRTAEFKSLFELDGVFEATAISGIAFMIAGAYRPTRGDT